MQTIPDPIDETDETLDTETSGVDPNRRFGGLARLYGTGGYANLSAAHAVVVGIGGVGSWTGECLARSGVGKITLIDMDHIAESNINRQIHAVNHTLGMSKVRAMRERIEQISPNCQIYCVEDFLSPDNLKELLPPQANVVIDCIDQLRPTVALAAWCRLEGLLHITCGAAGGKTDTSRIALCDLSETLQDPLLAKMRNRLRKEHDFAPAAKRMNVTAVFSSEPMRTTSACDPMSGLNCSGFGSAMHITATMGLMAAGWAINALVTANTGPVR